MPVGNYGHLSHSVRKRLPIFAAQKSSTGCERDDCGFRCIRRLGRICTPRYRVQQLREAVSTTGAEYSHLNCVSNPDGYTMLLGDVATYAANPSLYKKLPLDPAKDFAPVTLTARFVSVLVANPNKTNVKSVAELIEQAKKEPGKIDIAHAGTGNPFHL